MSAVDAALLRALLAQYPERKFDEVTIALDAPEQPQLMAALGFLEVKTNKRSNMLNVRSRRRIALWLGVAGRCAGGVRLERDRLGWCSVGAVVVGAKP
jgi:hypothetical protein